MGNRAVVIFFNQNGKFSPSIYLHWHGHAVPALLGKTRALMASRGPDLDYTAARFVGICHSEISGNLSLGISNSPPFNYRQDQEAMSPGDAGVFLVSVDTWEVERVGRYSESECDAPAKFTVPSPTKE